MPPDRDQLVNMLKAQLTDQPVAFLPQIANAVGGALPGLFLCQLLDTPRADPDGRVYKSMEEWKRETAMTRREQATARKRLKSLGVLEEHYQRLQHRMWFRVNFPVLFELLVSCHSPKRESARVTEEV